MSESKVVASFVMVVATLLAYATMQGNQPEEILATPAWIIGAAIAGAALIEAVGNVRNIIRADWIAILAIYGLTLAEFLTAQPDFNIRATVSEAETAMGLFSLGFIGLVVGRHGFSGRTDSGFRIASLSPNLVLAAFAIAFLAGFSAELIAVGFNPLKLIDAQMGPRFSQPWGRGKIGGIYSLLYELGLFKYAVPALAGVLVNYRQKIGGGAFVLVMAGLVFTLFFAFCGGTRNVFAAFLAGFVGTYLLTLPRLGLVRLSIVGAATLAVFAAGSFYMLEFRGMGLKRFISNYDTIETSDTFYVDYNMWAIGKLGLLFPEPYSYLGFELYWHAITKPIPRVLWPGKPVDLSTSIEGALEVQGLTIATTFIGESYMAFGEVGVFLTGLLLGVACGWWNFMGTRMQGGYGQLVYASGFAAIAIAMRSLMFFTTNMLPTVGLVVIGIWLNKHFNSESSPR